MTAESDVAAPEPGETAEHQRVLPEPVAEQALEAVPAAAAFWTDRAHVDALAAPPDVVVESGIRAEFDRQAERYSPAMDGVAHAESGGEHADAWDRVHAGERPLRAAVPEPLPEDEDEPPDLGKHEPHLAEFHRLHDEMDAATTSVLDLDEK